MRLVFSTLFAAAVLILVAGQKCPLQFEERVRKSVERGVFDTSASLYNPDYVKGARESCGFCFCFGFEVARWGVEEMELQRRVEDADGVEWVCMEE